MTNANQGQPIAPVQPVLSELMKRVKVAQNDPTKEGVDSRRRWRHCFHEAAHAFVGRKYGEDTEFIEVDAVRPRANMGKRNLKEVFAAVGSHGKGAKEVVEPALRFLSYICAGEVMEIEVEELQAPFSDRVRKEWDTKFGEANSDLKYVVKMADEAGFSHRDDLLQVAVDRVTTIIADHRVAYEALVIRLYDGGYIQQPDLGQFLNA